MKYFIGIVIGIVFVVVLWSSSFIFYDYGSVVSNIQSVGGHADAIYIAAQLGRLDFVSVMLALIGAVFLFAAFPFAKLVENSCINSVEKELQDKYEEFEREIRRKIEKDVIPGIEKSANEYLQATIPDMFTDYTDFFDSGKSDSDYDQMAGNQEGFKNE